jgi:DNA-binding NarL/FixJ family response regulator
MSEIRAIVADDSVVIRNGVARILGQGGFRVVAEARDAAELLDAVATAQPHLAVVDIRMPPGGNAGLSAALTIRTRYPTVGVLVLSQYLEPEYALRLLGAGVDRVGYLLKDRLGEATELLDAAHRVASGGSAIDPAVVQELVRARRRDDRIGQLTAREREVLGLIAEGRSNRSIAERLGIATKTLEGMSGTIFAKLGLEDDPDVNRRVLAVLLHLEGSAGRGTG